MPIGSRRRNRIFAPLVEDSDLQGLDPVEMWRNPLSTHAVARIWGVSGDTVRNWAEEGRFPARRLGRNWQIPRTVVRLVATNWKRYTHPDDFHQPDLFE